MSSHRGNFRRVPSIFFTCLFLLLIPFQSSLGNLEGGVFKGNQKSFEKLQLGLDARGNNGKLDYSLPITIPPGPGGLQPNLSIDYSSSGGEGPVGWGWSLPLSYIERRSDVDGLDYQDWEDFRFVSKAHSWNLIYVGANTDFPTMDEYRPEVDHGSGTRFFLDTSDPCCAYPVWKILTKDQQWQIFGSNSSGLLTGQAMPEGASSIFRWYLTTIKDIHDNEINYEYDFRDYDTGEMLYLTKITYGPNEIFFTYLDRTFMDEPAWPEVYVPLEKLNTGYMLKYDKVLDNIETKIADQWSLKYGFNYRHSWMTNRYLLESFETIGVELGRLPLKEFIYTGQDDEDLRYNSPRQKINMASALDMTTLQAFRGPIGLYKPWFPGDFNGDGCKDILHIWTDSEVSKGEVWLGDPGNTFVPQDEFTYQDESENNIPYLSTLGGSYDYVFKFGDFNGDGCTDVFHITSAITAYVWLSKLVPGSDGYVFDNFEFYEAQVPDLERAIGGNCSFKFNLPNDTRISADLTEPVQCHFLVNDFNKDGRDDLVGFYPQETTGFLGTRGYFFTLHLIDEQSGQFAKREYFASNGYNEYDFGRPDQDGTQGNDCLPDFYGRAGFGVNAIDLNGDGYSDLLCVACNELLRAFINKGLDDPDGDPYTVTGFDFKQVQVDSPDVDHVFGTEFSVDPIIFHFADVNLDGVLDFLHEFPDGANRRKLYQVMGLNNWNNEGIKFKVGLNLWEPMAQQTPLNWFRHGDFNGDGIADFVTLSPEFTTIPAYAFEYLANGNGNLAKTFNQFDPVVIYVQDVNNQLDSYTSTDLDCYPLFDGEETLVADFNGDGLSDYLNMDDENFIAIFSDLLNGRPDLLKEIRYGGRVVGQVDYATSSSMDNDGLGFSMPVVEEIRSFDGLGQEVSTNLEYSGGLYDGARLEFAGFATVKETGPDGSYVVKHYNQDFPLRGTVSEVKIYSPDDTLLRQEISIWEVTEGAGYYFPHLAEKTITEFSPLGPDYNLESHQAFQYHPVCMELERIVTSGTDAEEVTVERTFINKDQWLWRLESEEARGEDGTLSRAAEMLYTPQGDLTSREEAPLHDEARVFSFAYTDFGAVELKARSDCSAFEEFDYDATNTFVDGRFVTVAEDILKSESIQYDYRYGKPSIVNDFNAIRTYFQYDEHGRQTAMTKDDPSKAGASILEEILTDYKDDEFPFWIETRIRAGIYDSSINYLVSREYTDLGGRVIQKSAIGDTDSQGQSRYIVERKIIDEVNRTVTTLGPFFWDTVDFVPEASIPVDAPKSTQTFDPLGRLVETSRTTQDHGDVAETFDQNTKELVFTNPDGHQVRYTKNHLGNITKVEQKLMNWYSTTFDYNAAGEVETVVDFHGNQFTMDYDLLGRVKIENHPDIGIKEFAYHDNDVLWRLTEQDGLRTYTTLDPECRPDNVNYERGGALFDFTYDDSQVPLSKDRITSKSNAYWSWNALEYDGLGNLLGEIHTITGSGQSAEFQYEYDEASRLVEVEYPSGNLARYTYYPGSNLIQAVETMGFGNNLLVEFSDYCAFGAPRTVQYINAGIPAPFLFVENDISEIDGLLYGTKVLNTQSTTDPATHLINETYLYTPGGDLEQKIDYVKGAVNHLPDDAYIYEYEYDDFGRLDNVQESLETLPTINMEYDSIGRILQKKFFNRTVTYDYLGAGPHQVTDIEIGTSDFQIEYDFRGNVSADIGFEDLDNPLERAMGFNAQNRLSGIHYEEYEDDSPGGKKDPSERSASSPVSGTLYFRYDTDGNRIMKFTAVGDSTVYFNPYLEYRNGAPKEKIYLGGQLLAEKGNPTSTGNIRVFGKDRLGSVRTMTDLDGQVRFVSEYDAWGQPKEQEGEEWTKWQYTGQERDQDIQLFNYRAREYDPARSLFISPDSINPDIYDPQNLNPYTYVRNNPTRFVDPTGHVSERAPSYEEQKTYSEMQMRELEENPRDYWISAGVFGIACIAPYSKEIIGGGAALWNGVSAAANSGSIFVGVKITQAIGRGLTNFVQKVAGTSIGNRLFGSNSGSVRFGPMNPGPLSENVASTFRGGSYTGTKLSEATNFYRAYGGTAGEIGKYWSRTPPAGSLQSQIDLALLPRWGNMANQVSTIRVPPGTTVYEGFAASQGGLLGGGSQVVIPTVNPEWIIR